MTRPPVRNSGYVTVRFGGPRGQRKAYPSMLSASPDLASLWRMQLQGPVFVGVPLLGPILICMITHQLSSRCEDERKLPWCPPHKVILLVWVTIYSVMG